MKKENENEIEIEIDVKLNSLGGETFAVAENESVCVSRYAE